MRQARIALGMLLAALLLLAGGPGFRSREQFDEHFAKHGREFGNISQSEYLHLAQELRDAPAGGPVLEIVKPHGIVTRFDKRSGAFGAYNRDRTIRTFFKPNDGERYFRRQAERP
jgi:pyocin large subunit-like protein